MASIGSRVKKMLQMAENIVNNTTDSKSSNYFFECRMSIDNYVINDIFFKKLQIEIL